MCLWQPTIDFVSRSCQETCAPAITAYRLLAAAAARCRVSEASSGSGAAAGTGHAQSARQRPEATPRILRNRPRALHSVLHSNCMRQNAGEDYATHLLQTWPDGPRPARPLLRLPSCLHLSLMQLEVVSALCAVAARTAEARSRVHLHIHWRLGSWRRSLLRLAQVHTLR